MIARTLFWGSLGAIGWSYAGYPALLALMARTRPHEMASGDIEPTISLVIAAFNEEKNIRRKIENSLALDYPADKLQILVASDCSDDGTDDIVREYADRGVVLVRLEERGGKTAGQNAAVERAAGDVVVFTDATTEFTPGTLRDLIQGFADERVGCIGAELSYVSNEGTEVGRGAGAYWRYEKAVKALESRVHSLVGVSGCLYAVRRKAYRPLPPDLISDFVIASEMIDQGYVTVYGRGAVSREETNEDTEREFRMRTRVIIRSINALVRNAHMLDPTRYGFFSVQLFSHKVLRYAVPELLLVALGANAVLAAQRGPARTLYRAMLAGQLAAYGGAALGWASQERGWKLPLVHIPFYFTHANAAALWAAVQYLSGERMVTWKPIR